MTLIYWSQTFKQKMLTTYYYLQQTDKLLQFTTDKDMMLVKEAYLDLVSWLEQEQE